MAPCLINRYCAFTQDLLIKNRIPVSLKVMAHLLVDEKVFILELLFGPWAFGPNFGASKIAAQIWAQLGPKKITAFEHQLSFH